VDECSSAATRASGEARAFARGVASAGGGAVIAGVVPTPAVAAAARSWSRDLRIAQSAEYNGVKFFDRDGRKLSDAAEEEMRRCSTHRRPAAARSTTSTSPSTAISSTARALSDLSGLRIAVGARTARLNRTEAFEQLGADVWT
jgi:phosphoglucosamine mutase